MKDFIKDISYLLLTLFSLISLYDSSILSYRVMFYALTGYTFADLLFYKLGTDVYIHHTLVLSVFVLDYLYYDTIDKKISDMFSVLCLYFEVSSVFLAIISLLKKSSHSYIAKYNLINILNLLFYGTFIYYRLYYFSQIFLFNNELHIPLFDYCKNVQSIVSKDLCTTHFYGTFLGFALLNIYWFHLMTKIMVKSSGLKKIISKINTSTYEGLLGYTLYIKSFAVLFSYLFHIQDRDILLKNDHLLDAFAVIALSIASMCCHHTWSHVYKKIENKKSVSEGDIAMIQKYTFLDQLCIHIRSAAITYGICGNSLLFYSSLFFHTVTTKQLYDDLYDSTKIHKDIPIDDIISYINQSVHFNLGGTFLYDNLLVSFYNFFDYHCQSNLWIGMFIAGSFFIRPFYEANQIYVHLLLTIQALILSVLNVKY